MIKKITYFCLFYLISQYISLAYASSPENKLKIATSIKPITLIVQQITGEVANVEQILPNSVSPHIFQMTPSMHNKLNIADLIIWVGPTLEPNLTKPIKNISNNNSILTLLDLNLPVKLSTRDKNFWNASFEHQHHHHHHGDLDPHIWLSITNIKYIIQQITSQLANLDQQNKNIYEKNSKQLINKLENTKSLIKQKLSTQNLKKYIVFHDAYQYFEQEFQVQSEGVLTLNPEIPLGAKALIELKSKIKQNQIDCLFAEPEFDSKKINELAINLKLNFAILDPLGSKNSITKIEDLLLTLTDIIINCKN